MSKQPKNINKSGFTIIEVVLVLAIAGLIFLMVFVAFPALQRNQRDTQRRDDYAMLESQVVSASSTSGKVPNTNVYKIGQDGGDYGMDPKGLPYTIAFESVDSRVPDLTSISGSASDVDVYILHGTYGSYCDDDGTPYNYDSGEAHVKSFAIYGQLENATYCRTASI